MSSNDHRRLYLVLFKLGDWQVRNDDEHVAWATHTAKKCGINPRITKAYSWITSDPNAVCHYCQEPVPDEIQGLVILHGYASGV